MPDAQEEVQPLDVVACKNQFLISGRIIPERCSVFIQRFHAQSNLAEGRCVVDVEVISSHLSASFYTEIDNISPFLMADVLRQSMHFSVDTVAFRNRGYYDICLDTWRNVQTGSMDTFAVFEPFFSAEDENYTFKSSDSLLYTPIDYSSKSPRLARALHDLSQAIRYSTRTFEYCRMALESVRGHFDPIQTSMTWKGRHIAGEKAMCETLKLSRDRMLTIEKTAAPNRHGAIPTGSWERRREALEFSWESVNRFALFLTGTDTSQWAEI